MQLNQPNATDCIVPGRLPHKISYLVESTAYPVKPITVAQGIKVLRDKFLCHLDNFEDYDMQGGTGLSKGKWTPGDRIVLGHLLLPLVTVGPVDELVHLIARAVKASTEIGTQELLRTAFDKALEISQSHVQHKPRH